MTIMSQHSLTQQQLELVKSVVRDRLTEVAAGWHSQAKFSNPETEYSAGYSSAQDACSEHLNEVIEELMGALDGEALTTGVHNDDIS